MVARALPKVWFNVAAGLALSCALGGFLAESVEAQGRQSRARHALTTGIDCLSRGEYDHAGRFFEQAKAGADDLSEVEKQELASRIAFVAMALKARTDGSEQLQRAEEAVKDDRTQEALNLLRELGTNPYLRADSKQRLQQLTEQLQPRSAGSAPPPGPTGGMAPLLRARGMLKNARGLLVKGDLDTAETLAREAHNLKAPFSAAEDTPQKVLDDVGRARRVKLDAKALLASARAALERGAFDQAEEIAREAGKAESFWVIHLWGDSPSKVLKEVKEARAKLAANSAKALDEVLRKSAVPVAGVPDKAKDAVAQASGKDAGAPAKAKDAGAQASGKDAGAPAKAKDAVAATAGKDSGPLAKAKDEVAPAAVKEAGPLAKARDAVAQLVGKEAAPAKAKEAAAQANDKEAAPPKTSPAPASAKELAPWPLGPLAKAKAKEPAAITTPAVRDTEGARQLLQQGRKALRDNNLADAAQCARQARAKNPELYWWDDTPEKLQADVGRAQVAAGKAAPAAAADKGATTASSQATPTTPAESRTMLKEARDLYSHGKLDEAKELALKANAGSQRFGLFEDSPDKLMADIQKARLVRDKEDSVRLLAQARKLFEQGVFEEAEKLAYQAEKLHGSYSIWDLGDRPQKLVAEIETHRLRNRRLKVPPPPVQVAQNDPARKHQVPPAAQPNPATPAPSGIRPAAVEQAPPPPVWPQDNVAAPVAQVPVESENTSPLAGSQRPVGVEGPDADFTKQRARQLLAECRRFQQQGQLSEAHARAVAAQKLNVGYDPEEDRPERALLELASLAERQIENLKQAATDCAAQAKADPALFRKAEQDLLKARNLALAFGLDRQPLDSKLAFVRQLQGRDGPLEHGPIAPAQSGVEEGERSRGARLLEQSRKELRCGESGVARRMAEEAFSGNYGVQAEAAALLRSIDTEEFNMRQLANKRKVDAIVNSYNRKDYAQARVLVDQLDKAELALEQKNRLKELLQSPQMRPSQQLAVRPGDPRQPDDRVVPAAGNSAGADSFAQQVQAMQEIKFQQLRAEALKAQQEAMERFQAGAHERALDILQSFRTRLEESGLEADRVTLLRRPLDNRVQQFKTLKAQKEFESIAKDQVSQVNRTQLQRVVAEQEKHKQIADLMDKYKNFHKEGKYKEAEMYAMKAHELDPDNTVTGAAIYTARVLRQQKEANDIKNRRGQHAAEDMNRAEDPGPVVDLNDPMSLDKNRLEIARNRKFQGLSITKKTDKEREIERRLKAPINLEFKDTPLKQVIDDLRDMTGVNIITDVPALSEDGITDDKPLSMKLEGVSMQSALKLLLHNAGLTYIIKDEVLQVTTEKRARGKLMQKTFPVADLIIPVDNYMISPAADLQKVLNRSAQPGVQFGATQPYVSRNGIHTGEAVSEGSMGEATTPPQGRIDGNMRAGTRAPGQTDTMQNLLIRLITGTIAPQSWSDMGGPGTIDYFPIGMGLIINQTPDVLDQVQGLLDALRRLQDLEVTVEVRMISLEEAFFERIGVDFNLNIKTDRITHNFEPQVVTQQFKPTNFINDPHPKGVIAGLQPSSTGTSYSPGVSALTTDLDIPLHNSSFQYAIPPFGGFPNIPGSDGGLSMGLAFLSDIQVFMFLEAAQGDRRTNVMQAPKLTLFNGQTSTIQVQDFQWFVTNVQVVQSAGQVVFVPQNQPIPMGINLAVQAVVSADRRFVRMNLAPTMTNLASATVPLFPITTFITPVFEGGAQGQPVPFTQFIQQPTFTTITIQTTVSVPDGGTVLLGGLKLMNEGRNEFGPPVLSKIPYINRLFKNVGYGKDTSSLLLMVTPRIIINLEEEYLQTGQDSSGQYTQQQ